MSEAGFPPSIGTTLTEILAWNVERHVPEINRARVGARVANEDAPKPVDRSSVFGEREGPALVAVTEHDGRFGDTVGVVDEGFGWPR